MTYHEWLTEAEAKLQAKGIASAKIDSELMLGHTLGQSRSHIIAHRDDQLPNESRAKADQLLERRLTHEPMAFLLGEREFYGITFKTDKRALIPRGETEPLIETALTWLKGKTDQVVADIGTGAGTIILTLAHTNPSHTYMATELSPEALALARENAEQLHADVTFFEGNLADPLFPTYEGKVNLLVTNLPYISSELLVSLDPTVQYFEPNIALEGCSTGLELYEEFMPQAQALVAPGGLLLCEHDFDQGEAMRQLAEQYFPEATITTIKDGLGYDRILSCQL